MLLLEKSSGEEGVRVVGAEPLLSTQEKMTILRRMYEKDEVSADQLFKRFKDLGATLFKAKVIVGIDSGRPDPQLIDLFYQYVTSPDYKRVKPGRPRQEAPNLAKSDVKPLPTTPTAIDRRSDLDLFHRGPGVTVSAWKGLAAGFGEDLERASDVSLIDAPNYSGLHAVQIRGDSMEPTLTAGDVLLVENFAEGVELPTLEKGETKFPLRKMRSFVQDDGIYILQINGDAPTVKRIEYDVSSELDWKMIIKPDNPDRKRYRQHVLREYETLKVLGRVLGLIVEA